MIEWLLVIPFLFYVAFFLTALRKFPGKTGSGRKTAGSGTRVSVVIPCRNEEDNLPGILGTIASQNLPASEFEVIVVDDNSTDATFAVASAFKGISGYSVLRNKGHGKKRAILTGVEASGSELIVTTDADCRPSPSWLTSFSTLYDARKPAMIIGPVKLAESKGLLYIFQQAEWLGLQGLTAGLAEAGSPVMCNGANLGFRRDLFLNNYNLLKEKIPSGDDMFLLHAARQDKNNRIIWLHNPEGSVVTPPAGSLTALLRQRARWISKAGAYRDLPVILLSATVFLSVATLGYLEVATIFNIRLLPLLAACFILKNAADIPLIHRAGRFFGQKPCTGLVMLLQLIYPFYLTGVLFSLFPGMHRWKNG